MLPFLAMMPTAITFPAVEMTVPMLSAWMMGFDVGTPMLPVTSILSIVLACTSFVRFPPTLRVSSFCAVETDAVRSLPTSMSLMSPPGVSLSPMLVIRCAGQVPAYVNLGDLLLGHDVVRHFEVPLNIDQGDVASETRDPPIHRHIAGSKKGSDVAFRNDGLIDRE